MIVEFGCGFVFVEPKFDCQISGSKMNLPDYLLLNFV